MIQKIIKKHKKSAVSLRLTDKREMFAKLYATDPECYGDHKRAYMKVYNSSEANAGANAAKLINDPAVISKINEYLSLDGFNDQNVDKQLLFVINQHKDLSTKVKGIQEYNKLKKRINNTMEIVLPKPLMSLEDEDSFIRAKEQNKFKSVQYTETEMPQEVNEEIL